MFLAGYILARRLPFFAGFQHSDHVSKRTGMSCKILKGSISIFKKGNILGKVEGGILVGRLWYTHPVHGLRAGDFTGILIADAYLIEDGKLKSPIKVNTLRISDNIHNILMGIRVISKETKPTILWTADEIMYAARGILVEKVHLEEIVEFIETSG